MSEPFKSFPARDPKAGLPLLMLELHRQCTLGEAIEALRRLADLLQVAAGSHFQQFPLLAYPEESAEVVLDRYNQTRRELESAARSQALKDTIVGGQQ